MRNFVAVRPESLDGQLCHIGTSAGRSFTRADGAITAKQAIDFLFSLHSLAKRKTLQNPVFVWYAAHLEVERILSGLPKRAKDVLFPSPETERQRKAIKRAIRENETIIRSLQRKRDALRIGNALADFSARGKAGQRLTVRRREVENENQRLRDDLRALESVTWRGYRITIRAGKSLSIRRVDNDGCGKRGVTIFDLCHFFNKESLPDVARRYLGYCPDKLSTPAVDEALPLWSSEATKGEALRCVAAYAEAETDTIVKLAEVLTGYLAGIGLNLRRWYGASSAVNTLLNRWEARKEFRRVTPENTPRPLWHAIDCAFYGGRIETVKLGMLGEVYVYDLNSAFAYAASLLPELISGWRYTRDYDINEPFALWHVEYQLPESVYLGMLPFRGSGSGISYRRAGRGWYYSPEVRELARTYPGCLKIREGYVMPYSPARFAGRIREIYAHRRELIDREGKGKGERIFKSMLQCFYGKFAQTVGDAPFYCLPYAGWITSFVRAQMLEVVRGLESQVIYFHTDAIHSLKPLPVARVSDGLGDWTCNVYDLGFYMASGVHCFYNAAGEITKSATRGFEFIDFDKARAELNDPRNLGNVTLKREFYAGWQYHQNFPLRGEYLTKVEEQLTFNPKNARNRRFPLQRFNWSDSFIDSRIVEGDTARESHPRGERDYSKRTHLMLDIMAARR